MAIEIDKQLLASLTEQIQRRRRELVERVSEKDASLEQERHDATAWAAILF